MFFIFSFVFIDPEIPFYLKGILLAGPILFHPFLGILCLGTILIYVIIHFIILKVIRKKNRDVISKFIKENLYILIIFWGILIPVMINITLKFKIDWYLNYMHYIFPAAISSYNFSIEFNTLNISPIIPPISLGGNFTIERLKCYFEFLNFYNFLFFKIFL